MPQPESNRATFTVTLGEVKCAASGDQTPNGAPGPPGHPTVRGHAAVFGRRSHDLGGYRVMIQPGAFTKVLDTNPDVHLVWDHNTRYTLARTKNKSLELREDPLGLHIWARMANTATAKELAILMEGGYIDQMSFACDIGASEWTEDADGNITRTIQEVDALYDVTICAQGAFPQTDAQLVASLKDASSALEAAREAGFVRQQDKQDSIAEPEDQAEGAPSVAARGGRDLAALQARAKTRLAQLTHPE